MTAITNAVRSTQPWGDDALGPNSFEAPTFITEDQIKERRLYAVTPELEHHVESEWEVLDHWVAFNVAPHFVEQIYRGEPLELSEEEALHARIIPVYETRRVQYLQESAHIVGSYIPGIKRRIGMYEREAQDLDESIAYNEQRIEAGAVSPALKSTTDSWRRQSRAKHRLVRDLHKDIPNAELNAKVKDAMFYRINDLVKRTNAGEDIVPVDDIVHSAKKIAIEQVITITKSEKSVLKPLDPKAEEKAQELEARIVALQAELVALDAVEFGDVTIELDTVDTRVAPERDEGALKDFRRRLIGGFGLLRSSTYGALFR